ncbi:hypothetical protein VNO77_27654 [Canavalia gladiata]|uniref:F-box and leucine rich repeat protein 2 n=1 Tax=Canavalia gladiata TaxID=3824 RepID=A0AAN9KV22_CANGL
MRQSWPYDLTQDYLPRGQNHSMKRTLSLGFIRLSALLVYTEDQSPHWNKITDVEVDLGVKEKTQPMTEQSVFKLRWMIITEWRDIPMVLLMQILSLVDDQTVITVSGVCCDWRDAIYFGLARLSFSWCSYNMNSVALSLVPKFTKLQTLILRQDKPQLADDVVETIAKYYHELQILDLNESFKLTNRTLYAIALGCRDLTKLNISTCLAFSDNALPYLASFCKKLKVLNLYRCVKAASDTTLQAIG